ncbi:DUF3810 domain-containing protein [Butyrivibrio sp. DSM 10294]|uniref:DUF3810 domain-containing protein n=1 Tax=Butyrivibrio sp. DSM 10294 TaxID=2972457 RepID=UPI00234F8CE7|nr:DUF3810 domain-containing protein [Butyrivibrio sp. DSM 10294]MDC7292144.1 DUF3810 domain-containing protein [Butyrivibrio sp. DSM 10294]
MKTKKAFSFPVVIALIFSVIFNLVAWKSATFSDFYTDNIFPKITSVYSRLTSLLPFSFGEWLLVAVVIYVVVTVVFILLHTIFLIVFRLISDKKDNEESKLTKVKKVLDRMSDFFYHVTPILLAITCVVMSLNCFVLYHCTKVPTYAPSEEYDLQQLADLRDYMVKKCNELSKQMPRDEKGNVVYEGDMTETARAAMRNLSKDYKRFDGYFGTPKELYFSEFMCQQYMQGYYFPFSMEANINSKMSIMNKPFTMCHELAHTQGYIYEDEANFFGFLACIRSDDIVFQYSGYLGVLNYINNDFYRAVDKSVYNSHVKISDRVKYDNQFVTEEEWKEVEKKAVIKTETVKKAADVFIDTNLKVNGVLEGKVNYTQVVGLIMDYYYYGPDGNL